MKTENRVVAIESVSSDGRGLTHLKNGKVLFVEGALPDEQVEVAVTRETRDYAVAQVVRYLSQERRRCVPACRWYETCGGCNLQHATYELQLQLKTRIVKDAFQRIAGMEPIHGTDECIASPRAWKYRNKASFPVRKTTKGVKTGFFREKTHDIVPLDACSVIDGGLESLFRNISGTLPRFPIAPYDEKRHSGLLRHIVLRSGTFTGDIVLGLVCRQMPDAAAIDALRAFLGSEEVIPRGVCININPDRSNVILGAEIRKISGEISIRERLGHFLYRYGIADFFQVNSFQAKRLYEYAAAEAGDGANLLELYSGIGSLTMYLARHFRKVVAVEEWPSAAAAILQTCEINGIRNVTAVTGCAEDTVGGMTDSFETVLVDPPRTGCDRVVLEELGKKLRPAKIVYVSCNPATLSRDIRILSENGYGFLKARPFDMFPQTTHVECVATLIRKNSSA